MGMSVWGLIAAPLMTPAVDAAPQHQTNPVELAETATADDIFSGDTVLNIGEMRDAAGGTDAATNIAIVEQNNNAVNTGTNTDINVNNSTNGEIAANTVQGNDGLSAVQFNTGNGVNQIANFQVNVYLGTTGLGAAGTN